MSKRIPRMGVWGLILAGIGFGAYFTFGFWYFGTLNRGEEVDGSEGIWDYLPVFLIMALICSVAAWIILLGKGKDQSGWQPHIRNVGLVLGTLLIAGLAVFSYVGIGREGQSLDADLLMRVYRDLLLVGLLPAAAVLVLIQGKRKPVREPINSPKQASHHHPGSPLPNPDPSAVHPPRSSAPESIKLRSGTTTSIFELLLEELLFVEAADNYCKIYFFREQETQMEMLRIKMKEVETAIGDQAFIFRCHRSFLVNGKQIQEIMGNSQAYKLRIKNHEGLIPVSRSFDVSQIRPFIT